MKTAPLPLSLAGASERLRDDPPLGFPRRSGRPRTRSSEAVQDPVSGPSVGQVAQDRRAQGGPHGGALASLATVPIAPRLLDLEATAAYLGVSPWTVRDLMAAGVLPRVRIPFPRVTSRQRRSHDGNGGVPGDELRKVLLDREDLDRLISAWKERADG